MKETMDIISRKRTLLRRRKRRRQHGEGLFGGTKTFATMQLLILLTSTSSTTQVYANDESENTKQLQQWQQQRRNGLVGQHHDHLQQTTKTQDKNDDLICHIITQSTIHARKNNVFQLQSTESPSPSWIEDIITLCTPVINGIEIDGSYSINLPDSILESSYHPFDGLYVSIPNGKLTNDSVVGYNPNDIVVLKQHGDRNGNDQRKLVRERNVDSPMSSSSSSSSSSLRPLRPLPILPNLGGASQPPFPDGGPIIPLPPSASIETRTILILRVSLQDSTPTISSQQIYENIFGYTDITLQSQYNRCSSGKLRFEPAPYGNLIGISNGILDVSINDKVLSDFTTNENVPVIALANAAQDKAIQILGLDSTTSDGGELLSTLADHTMICLPPGLDNGGGDESIIDSKDEWIASASVNHWRSIYNDGYCGIISTTMHEIGHNLGLYHANHQGSYRDYTSYMSAGLNQLKYPQKCFNGQNHARLGWFDDRTLKLNTDNNDIFNNDGDDPTLITLAAFVDYNKLFTIPSLPHTGIKVEDIVVIISIDDKYYLQFNVAKGPNIQTEIMVDQVTIVEDLDGGTELLAGIDIENPEYRIEGFFENNSDLVMRVCHQNIGGIRWSNDHHFVDYVTLSIGRDQAICPTPPTSSPTTAPTFSPTDSPSKNPTIDPDAAALGDALNLLLEKNDESDRQTRGSTTNNIDPDVVALGKALNAQLEGVEQSDLNTRDSTPTNISTATSLDLSSTSDLRPRANPSATSIRPGGVATGGFHNNVVGPSESGTITREDFLNGPDDDNEQRPRGENGAGPRPDFEAALLRGSSNKNNVVPSRPEPIQSRPERQRNNVPEPNQSRPQRPRNNVRERPRGESNNDNKKLNSKQREQLNNIFNRRGQT